MCLPVKVTVGPLEIVKDMRKARVARVKEVEKLRKTVQKAMTKRKVERLKRKLSVCPYS